MQDVAYERIFKSSGSPYIIAELGSNHNGNSELACKLIEAAKECGAHCVKFQSWSKASIFSRKVYDDNYFVADDYRSRDDHTLESIVEAYSFGEEQLSMAKEYAAKIGIDFASTPFSPKEVDFLVDELDAPFIKVASMDLVNYPFLDYIARKQRPVILSTGMGEAYEIDRAVRTIERAGNRQIALLHCVSLYPPKDSDVDLRNLDTLRQLYPEYPIGFSDHTLGVTIPLAAVARGARIVEKHFTLDKEMEGWDHKVSAVPSELRTLCTESARIVNALGSTRILVREDAARIQSFRRSAVTTRALKKGDVIAKGDIAFKRPATGIAPEYLDFIIGRTVSEDLPSDYPLTPEQLV